MPTELSYTEFDFKSPREWEDVPTGDVKRMVLTCPAAATTLTLTMDAFAIPADKFEEVARKVLETRKQAHRERVQAAAQPGETVELLFGDELVFAHPSGQAWQVSYTGSLKGKNVFAFVGYVTSRKIVHLYIDSKLPLAESNSDGAIFTEVMQGFQVLIP